MKRTLVTIVFFIVGLACGYAINQYFPIGSGSSAAVASGDTQESDAEKPPVRPLSETLSERFLPNTAPYWVRADLDQCRKQGEVFSDLLEEKAVSKVMQEFTASLPAGATPALSDLCRLSSEMRLFILPPKENVPTPALVAVFSQPEDANGESVFSASGPLCAAYPDSSTSEVEAGEKKINVLTTPIAEFAWLYEGALLWVCNQKDALVHLWTESPPEEAVESPGPHVRVSEDYPDAAVTLFVNAAHPGEAMPGPMGALTNALRHAGVRHAVALTRYQDKSGKLTILAEPEKPVPWMEAWQPLDRYPFGKSDPTGIMEIAMRWPNLKQPASATATVPANTPPADKDGSKPVKVGKGGGADEADMIRVKMERGGRSGEMKNDPSSQKPRGEGRQGRNRNAAAREGRRGGNPEGLPVPRGNRTMGGRRGGGGNPKAPFIAQAQLRLLSELVPPNHVAALNLFGFQDGIPAVALVMPDVDPENSLVSRFKKYPSVETSDVEIAMIPGTRIGFGDNPMSRMLGLSELVSIERDAMTYLFDAETAARNYLGELSSDSDGEDRRSQAIRSLIDEVRSPAQIEAVFSKDLFRTILDQERDGMPKDFEHQEEFSALIDEVLKYIEPMALTAGAADGQWFLETYSETKTAHLIGSGLMLRALYRFMGN